VPTVTIELPSLEAQTGSNLRRWAELLDDPTLARIEGRVETDRHGHIIMTPPPAPIHGSYQCEVAYLLRRLMPRGRVLSECPISTADGVKAADVAWASAARIQELGDQVCFVRAPEICVEVLSPGNTEAEMREKMMLYFDAGAREVWLCDFSGTMRFFEPSTPQPVAQSQLCPQFPRRVVLT
jgi:Uma2 family endonuclease